MRFRVTDLGLIDFEKAWNIQKEAHLWVRDNALAGWLFFCQHHPVITLGRLARQDNILIAEGQLKEKSLACYRIERGGDVTYHGPGQLTAYPVFNLNHFKKDIHWFLRQLEEVAISLLADFNIIATKKTGITGVWVEDKKIASIGIAVKNWITYHGMSIVIKRTDLGNFNLIRPCGMNIGITSLESILNQDIEMSEVKEKLRVQFNRVFMV